MHLSGAYNRWPKHRIGATRDARLGVTDVEQLRFSSSSPRAKSAVECLVRCQKKLIRPDIRVIAPRHSA
jgi:hypothetical protein